MSNSRARDRSPGQGARDLIRNEQTERVPGRVKVDADAILRLILREDRTGGSRVRAGGVEIVHRDSRCTIICWSPAPAGHVGRL